MTKRISRFVLLVAVCVTGGGALIWGETGSLVVLVQNAQKRPIKGVEIGVEGLGGSKVTGNDGKALLSLAKGTKESDWVSLQLLSSPSGTDLAMVSPYDGRTPVPSFENKPENFVRVVVVQRGDLAALQNGTVLRALTEKINKANTPKSVDKQAAPENPKANLEAVAKQFRLSPEELDKAIKAWGAKTTDTYEAGLAALYSRNYDKATADLQTSLSQREEKLGSDQKAVGDDQKQVADAAFFLGSSLYEQGKYKESAAAFQRCLQIRADDPLVLNETALSLTEAGDYAAAEPLYRRALAINERTVGPDHRYVAINLNNLATLLQDKGDYEGAEPLFRRALAVDERALPPEHPYIARDLNNLALLLKAMHDYAGAEPLFRRALEISENTLGPDDPSVATCLNNLAMLLYETGEYGRAESLMRRAVAIDQETLRPDDPDVANSLDNLAGLLYTEGNYAEAESLHRRALAIYEKAQGPDHPEVATCLSNLALVLEAKGDYTGAETLMRRALAIDEAALGPDHPKTRHIKRNLDALLQRSSEAPAPKAKD